MTANRFAEVCAFHGIDPAIALEDDSVVQALKTAKTYPACMRADADALIEDTIAGAF